MRTFFIPLVNEMCFYITSGRATCLKLIQKLHRSLFSSTCLVYFHLIYKCTWTFLSQRGSTVIYMLSEISCLLLFPPLWSITAKWLLSEEISNWTAWIVWHQNQSPQNTKTESETWHPCPIPLLSSLQILDFLSKKTVKTNQVLYLNISVHQRANIF